MNPDGFSVTTVVNAAESSNLRRVLLPNRSPPDQCNVAILINDLSQKYIIDSLCGE